MSIGASKKQHPYGFERGEQERSSIIMVLKEVSNIIILKEVSNIIILKEVSSKGSIILKCRGWKQ
jgi:hypothetical protein